MLQSDSFAHRMSFLGEGPMISQNWIVLDLALDKRRAHAKFDYSDAAGVQMHKEQTNNISSLCI